METAHLIVLAVTQGISEFLPISSSAHLVLVSHFLSSDVHALHIDIFLHGATLLAVVLYLAKDLVYYVKNFFLAPHSQQRIYTDALIFATIPVLIVGLLSYQSVEALRTPPIVALALIISGFALIVADYAARRNWIDTKLSLRKKGLGIGLFQTLSLIPGVSRSGITIAACRSLGFSRQEAVRFSFLLSVPVILAATLLASLQQAQQSGSLLAFVDGPLLLACAVAFAVSYATIHYFLKLVSKLGFVPFFAYQVALGFTILLTL